MLALLLMHNPVDSGLLWLVNHENTLPAAYSELNGKRSQQREALRYCTGLW